MKQKVTLPREELIKTTSYKVKFWVMMAAVYFVVIALFKVILPLIYR